MQCFSLTEFRAAQIQCFYRIKIAKIACALCNLKNPCVDGRLRLPDYTQCEIRFCDTAVFRLICFESDTNKMGVNLKLINFKFETEILKFALSFNNLHLSNL